MFFRCTGGPHHGRLLLAGDDSGMVTLTDGRYVLSDESWEWKPTGKQTSDPPRIHP